MNMQDKVHVASLSLAANGLLLSTKIVTGLLTGSVSVASQALYSGVTFLAAAVTLSSFLTSKTVIDGPHPHRGRKLGDVIGLVQAAIILLFTGWVIFHAMEHTLSPDAIGEVRWGIVVMLISAAVNMAFSSVPLRLGGEKDSIGLLALARHHRVDAYGSIAVAAALFVLWAAHVVSPQVDVRWVDTVAAIVVAILIIEAALDLIMKSGCDLWGSRLLCAEEMQIQELIADHRPQLRGLQHVRTRKAGSFRFVDLHVKADHRLSSDDLQDIVGKLSESLRSRFLRTVVMVHVEQCRVECDDQCPSDCFLTEKTRLDISDAAGH